MINRIKEVYYDFIDIVNYRQQIKLMKKRITELEREPQLLKDKMNLMKIEIRELKLERKELLKEINKWEIKMQI